MNCDACEYQATCIHVFVEIWEGGKDIYRLGCSNCIPWNFGITVARWHYATSLDSERGKELIIEYLKQKLVS
jgi:hypothetical protein